ncbi:hypothetical protein BDB00DRAFT_783059 [Zychaea mexicana]|uniref:uncharacterized protein n=1 Tax=Zychaea mexicana TaxID=64656 RepID=UPI0022FDF969|nr:uncharacterized protein BDB00DRAFT_783059 [Zychaea mexicana]KAI9499570.1 hypothetical protein BDB00DRAFT_783059 [Zychaea mexicana]
MSYKIKESESFNAFQELSEGGNRKGIVVADSNATWRKSGMIFESRFTVYVRAYSGAMYKCQVDIDKFYCWYYQSPIPIILLYVRYSLATMVGWPGKPADDVVGFVLPAGLCTALLSLLLKAG